MGDIYFMYLFIYCA